MIRYAAAFLLAAVLIAAALSLGGCSPAWHICLFPPEISDITYFSYSAGGGMELNSGVGYGAVLEDGVVTVTVRQSGVAEEDAVVIVSPDIPVMQRLRAIVEEYGLNRWDGFMKSNKHVMDGSSFSLYIQMDNGESITASGYMKWPRNYSDAASDISSLFQEVYAAQANG